MLNRNTCAVGTIHSNGVMIIESDDADGQIGFFCERGFLRRYFNQERVAPPFKINCFRFADPQEEVRLIRQKLG